MFTALHFKVCRRYEMTHGGDKAIKEVELAKEALLQAKARLSLAKKRAK